MWFSSPFRRSGSHFLFRAAFLISIFASLSACSLLPAHTPSSAEPDEEASLQTLPQPAPEHYRPIPAKTLYTLLVAEMAGHRQQYQLAFDLYFQEASESRDPAIAERTTRIAQYLGYRPYISKAMALWLDIEPDNPAVHQVAAQLQIELGDLLQALQHMQVVEQRVGISQYDVLASHADQITTEEQELLLNKLEAMRQEQPKNAILWVATGLLKQALKQPESALADIEKALQLDAKALPAALHKARLLATMQRQEDALTWLERLHKQHPNSKSVQVLRARILLEQRKVKEALASFAALHQQFPEDANISLSLALLYDETGEPEKARQALFQLLANGERVNEAHFYLGRISEKIGDVEQALEQYRQVGASAEFMPAQVRSATLIGQLYSLDEARDFLQNQQNDYPEFKANLFSLEVELLVNAEQPQAAIQLISQGLEALAPEEQLDLLYMRGMLYEQLNKQPQFEQDMHRILALDADNVNALNALGYIWAVNNQHLEKAQQLLEKAYALSPDSPAIADSLGWLYFRIKDLPLALRLLEQSFSAMQDAEIAAHLGEVLWAMGKQQQALEVFKIGIANKADHPVLLETLQRLNIQLTPEL